MRCIVTQMMSTHMIGGQTLAKHSKLDRARHVGCKWLTILSHNALSLHLHALTAHGTHSCCLAEIVGNRASNEVDDRTHARVGSSERERGSDIQLHQNNMRPPQIHAE